MDFFNLGLSVVLKLINQCLDEAYVGIMLLGGIGLVIGLALVVACYRTGLFQRRRTSMRFVSFLYPVYLPLLFGITGSVIGGTWYAEDKFVSEVHETVTPITRDSFLGFQLFVRRSWSDIEAQQIPFSALVDHFTTGIRFETHESMGGWLEERKIDVANALGPKTARWGLESIVHAALTFHPDAPDPSQLSPEDYDAKALRLTHEADIFSYPDQFWHDVDAELTKRIEGHFNTIYLQSWGVFALLLLLPAVETLINYRRPR